MIPASPLVAVAAAETLRRALGSLRTSERPLWRAERMIHPREMRMNAQKMGFLDRTTKMEELMMMMIMLVIGVETAVLMGKVGLER